MTVGGGELEVLHPVGGVRMAAVSAGIKKPGRLDVVLFELASGSVTGGVFTTNAFCAAPVVLCKQHLAQTPPRYFLINTGNANAGTGMPGMQAAQSCCEALAQTAGVSSESVLPFSTGVIGELLPAARINAVVGAALAELTGNEWHKVARGIMTTDTRPKAASTQLQLGGSTITMQLANNISFDSDTVYARKLKEIPFALRIQRAGRQRRNPDSRDRRVWR